MGEVVVADPSGFAAFKAELWDGTNVITSTVISVNGVGGASAIIPISGCTTVAPAGNIRISVEDTSSTGGTMYFNASGLSKDSHIAVWRVQ